MFNKQSTMHIWVSDRDLADKTDIFPNNYCETLIMLVFSAYTDLFTPNVESVPDLAAQFRRYP